MPENDFHEYYTMYTFKFLNRIWYAQKLFMQKIFAQKFTGQKEVNYSTYVI